MIRFKAVTFEGRKTAAKALDTLEENFPMKRWVDDVALVSRGKLGVLRVHSTWAQNDDTVDGGIGWGAITGGLLGALAGPAGAVAGAIGGSSVGGLIGTGIDIDMADPELEAFAQSLDDDTSALVLVADDPTLAEFSAGVETVGGRIIETDINERDIKALRKALKS